ncbi:MAG: CoA-binding protein [Planctomycetaceae bacterium]|nr:CoA-binding protein [Planctomycetaceae bacterium]
MNASHQTSADGQKTVAVIGASPNRRKYGNKSVRAHLAQGWRVFPVHPTAEQVEGLTAYPTLAAIPVEKLDRITVYVPPQIGIDLLDEMAAKHPHEVWLNPGAESEELVAKAEGLGLPIIQAYSIVDLGVRPSQFAD